LHEGGPLRVDEGLEFRVEFWEVGVVLDGIEGGVVPWYRWYSQM